MASVGVQNGPFTVVAYRGDAKTLLAFELSTGVGRKRLAGLTFKDPAARCGGTRLLRANKLTFKDPSGHAQNPNEPTQSSLNSPIHRFRWVHHPGLYHQGLNAAMAFTGIRSRPTTSTTSTRSCPWMTPSG